MKSLIARTVKYTMHKENATAKLLYRDFNVTQS